VIALIWNILSQINTNWAAARPVGRLSTIALKSPDPVPIMVAWSIKPTSWPALPWARLKPWPTWIVPWISALPCMTSPTRMLASETPSGMSSESMATLWKRLPLGSSDPFHGTIFTTHTTPCDSPSTATTLARFGPCDSTPSRAPLAFAGLKVAWPSIATPTLTAGRSWKCFGIVVIHPKDSG